MEVPIEQRGGVYEVKVLVNDLLYLPFIVDSGASDVQVGPEELMLLIKNGAVEKSDMLPPREYMTADGTKTKQKRFVIRKMRLGTLVVHNVQASITPQLGVSLLLGQSFLRKLGSWKLDYQRSVLVVDEGQAEAPVAVTPATLNGWQQYQEEDGTFNVTLPVAPKVEHDPKTGMISVMALMPGERGLALLRHQLDEPLTEEELHSKTFMPTFIATLEKGSDPLKVKHYDQFAFRGFPAISLLATNSNSQIFDMLCVFTGNHIYQLMTVRPENSEDFDDNTISQFVQSFHVSR